jgi:tetratricopeptide (TPR) repeat protein
LSLSLHHPDAIVAHCEGLLAGGQADAAAICLSRANRQYPEDSRLLVLNGRALLALGQTQAAIGALMLALRLQPGCAAAHARLVEPLARAGDLDGAVKHGSEAFRLEPSGPHAGVLSGLLSQRCQYAEALTLADTALGLEPEDPTAWVNRALALDGLGRTKDATDAGQRAVALAPDDARARYHHAERLLRRGELTQAAWRLYEARLALNGYRASPSLRVWAGEDITGLTILLHAEQGLGDTLQFVRYAPLVAARAGRVILAVPPPLLRLLHAVPGVEAVVPTGGPMPPFDIVCPLLSLPRLFATTLDTVPPALPYADAFEGWDDATTGLRVGLVWAGEAGFTHDRQRSLALDHLALLAGVPGVQFYSLQHHTGLPPALPPELGAIDLMLGVEDLSETAALIAGLDLVIAVDTAAVAHLAATMGKPVWLLSRLQGCWRWLEKRADSPWYPSLRIIRQQSPNDWGTPLCHIRRDLAELGRCPPRRIPTTRRRPDPPGPLACKLCGTASSAIGVVDFNRSCEDARQAPLPRSGRRVTYHRCPGCALVFTGDFDRWGSDEFRRHIYNDGYARVDPDYAVERPAGSAAFIASLFGEACRDMDVLDYGGGNGALAGLLCRDHGMRAVSYDPFDPASQGMPTRRFPLVTCFEVLEHSPDPRATIRAIAGLVQDGGFVLFSTLVQPDDFDRQGMTWWYVAPRNGHVTLFSKQALAAAWAEAGFEIRSHTDNLHWAQGR